jgi:uncharacterized protein with PIN domain
MTDRRCPKCHGEVAAILAHGRIARWHGDELYECETCATAYPHGELEPAPERPYNERAERQEVDG